MERAVTFPDFSDSAPDADHLTPYDERLAPSYLRLLDAETEGADWREAVQIIFGIDPAAEPERAKRVHASHLARAHWMTEIGFAYLLRPKPH